jgi:hypothetical protein
MAEKFTIDGSVTEVVDASTADVTKAKFQVVP